MTLIAVPVEINIWQGGKEPRTPLSESLMAARIPDGFDAVHHGASPLLRKRAGWPKHGASPILRRRAGRPEPGYGPASGDGHVNADSKATAERLAGDLMKRYGLTREQAVGAVGVMSYESGDFRQMQEMNQPMGRGGWGWAQWTGPRRQEFFQVTKGMDPKSYEANEKMLFHELDTGYSSTIPALKQARSPEQAANIYEHKFEGMTEGGPGIPAFAGHMAKATQYNRIISEHPDKQTYYDAAMDAATGAGHQ